MNNEYMDSRPNLFQYATSELSQDAVFAYLLHWADPQFAATDPHTHELGKSFIRLLTGIKPEEISSVTVGRQWENIDIWAKINDDSILIIEDKTFTQEHDNQLKHYIEITEKYYGNKDHSREKRFYVYISPFNQCLRALSANFTIIDRRKLLALFEDYQGKNTLLLDYQEHLCCYEQQTQSFRTTPLKEWSAEAWQGFYMYLNQLRPDFSWNYVANPSGGFWGCNWHWREVETDQVMLFLLFDQEKLCIKLCCENIDSERRYELMYKYRELCVDCDIGQNLKIERPARLRRGNYITVAQVQLHNIQGFFKVPGIVNIDGVSTALLPYEQFIDSLTASA